MSAKRTRAEINRANAKKSTGPETVEGKAASSKNAFKHGLYSKSACIPGENPEDLDALRADLRAEHQPASPTEEILVDELAHHYWRINRYRYLETHMWAEQGRGADGGLDADVKRVLWMIDHGMAALFHRTLTSAERSFHKTLKTLQETKKARGFVSQSQVAVAQASGAAALRSVVRDEAAVLSEPKTQFRFVPQNREATPPTITEMFAAAQNNLGLSASELLKLLKSAA